MRYVGFIFARGGSKGLPGKNIRKLAGKPLIAWSIEHARAVARIERVIVSTDSPEIADVALRYGAEVPFLRPVHLAQDDSPEWLAWRDALQHLQEAEGTMPDVMVSLPATSPLRSPTDVERCIDEYEKGEADMIVTVTEAARSPYFNMVKHNQDGTVGLVIEPAKGIVRRQAAPSVYDMTTVAYVVGSPFVMDHMGVFAGRVRAVIIPRERAVDIDTLFDFSFAEFLIAREGAGHAPS